MKSKEIVTFILLVLLAIIVQLFPTYTSESYIMVTALSALFIAFITASKPNHGILAAFLTFILVMIFDPHEALFFAFTNAIIGWNIGNCYYNNKSKNYTSLAGGILLSLGIIILITVFDQTPLGSDITNILSKEMLGFFTFAIIYTYIYNLIFRYIFGKVKKFIA